MMKNQNEQTNSPTKEALHDAIVGIKGEYNVPYRIRASKQICEELFPRPLQWSHGEVLGFFEGLPVSFDPQYAARGFYVDWMPQGRLIDGVTRAPIESLGANTMEFRTACHPEANGRTPQPGESAWTFTFLLEDGRRLGVLFGETAFKSFKAMIMQMDQDDATEATVRNANDFQQRFRKDADRGSHRAPQVLLVPVGKRKEIDWTPETLKKMDADATIPAGTNIFTPRREFEDARPERALADLMGKTVTKAVYLEDGPHGPGLYADCLFLVPEDSQLAVRWTVKPKGFLCRGMGMITVNNQVLNMQQPFKEVTSLELFD